MTKWIAAAFALTFATSAYAMTPVPVHQPDGMVTQVRLACGPGRSTVSASPGPPFDTPAEPSVDVPDGMVASAFVGIEYQRAGDISQTECPPWQERGKLAVPSFW